MNKEKEYKVDINKEMDKLLTDIDKNFNEIVRINKPFINYIIGLIRYKHPITYEDLYQESLIELYRICKKYKKITKSFTAYFGCDLKNHLINYVQRNQFVLTIPYNELREKSYEDLESYKKYSNDNDNKQQTDESSNLVEDEVFQNYFKDDRLDKIKEELSEEEWNLLYAMVVEDYSTYEYAKKIGISGEGVRLRWKKLQKKLNFKF